MFSDNNVSTYETNPSHVVILIVVKTTYFIVAFPFSVSTSVLTPAGVAKWLDRNNNNPPVLLDGREGSLQKRLCPSQSVHKFIRLSQ
jgi:hypothetical protein